MKIIENKVFDEERALYGSDSVLARNCRFEGPADGESAFKESKNITVEDCYWDLRYPFWHDTTLTVKRTHLTEKCRAALWYSDNISICDSTLHGIKALRECSDVKIEDCDVISPEFGWFVRGIKMRNTTVSGEYFMLRSERLKFENVTLNGKYSFQYIEDSTFESCYFNTKDAFWHAKNVTVRNSVINGEYLAWYAENITFENCIITGTQPLCYCKGLKLINCEMHGADLGFEKSHVEADITTPVISIKNPTSGVIRLPAVDELIMTGADAKCKIEIVQ
ncbi:MAG: DUF3737 family protein [Clostridia bacterium]|nr:DUF3737 family protein [Clostridia bacterium]